MSAVVEPWMKTCSGCHAVPPDYANGYCRACNYAKTKRHRQRTRAEIEARRAAEWAHLVPSRCVCGTVTFTAVCPCCRAVIEVSA